MGLSWNMVAIRVIASLDTKRWREYKELVLEALQEEPSAFSESYGEAKGALDAKWQNDLATAAAGKSIIVFAEQAGRLIGMGKVNFHEKKAFRHNAFLTSLFVKSDFRGQGLGELLTRTRLDLLRQKPGVANVFCEVIETQHASIRLHQKLGFEVCGRLRRFYAASDSRLLDELIMQQKLEPAGSGASLFNNN